MCSQNKIAQSATGRQMRNKNISSLHCRKRASWISSSFMLEQEYQLTVKRQLVREIQKDEQGVWGDTAKPGSPEERRGERELRGRWFEHEIIQMPIQKQSWISRHCVKRRNSVRESSESISVWVSSFSVILLRTLSTHWIKRHIVCTVCDGMYCIHFLSGRHSAAEDQQQCKKRSEDEWGRAAVKECMSVMSSRMSVCVWLCVWIKRCALWVKSARERRMSCLSAHKRKLTMLIEGMNKLDVQGNTLTEMNEFVVKACLHYQWRW